MILVGSGPWRHRRVWLRPEAVARPLLDQVVGNESSDVHAIARWAQGKRPFVGRAWTAADEPSAAGTHVPLGLAILGAGKRRVSFTALREDVIEESPPLTLRETLAALPARHAKVAEQVLDGLGPLGAGVAIYGSAFWSHAAGESHMSSTSDLDLLISPAPRSRPEPLLARLQELADRAAVRIDGEVLLRDGSTVKWRELAGRPVQVLARTDKGPRICALDEAWAQWP
jgi:phosphoribosyl-dephospho-CoA transferase